METSAFSSSQTPRIMESTPTLPDGDCIVNVYDSMVADKGGVKVCDMIETWSEIEAIRKDSKKRKNVDDDLEGSFIQRKFKCTGHSISGDICDAEKVVGFAKGKSRKFRTLKYINKHICTEVISKRMQLETQIQSVSVPKVESNTTPRVTPSNKTQIVYDLTFGLACEICEKRFRYERGLRRHILQKHSSSDDQERICNVIQQIPKDTVSTKMIACAICRKMYQKQNTLNRHIREKHTNQDKNENDILDSSSSMDELPSSPLPSTSTPELGSHTDTDTETGNADRQNGYNAHFIGASERDLDDQIRIMKIKNDKDLVLEKKDDANNIVKTLSNAYLHGAAQAIVKNIVTHHEFQEELKCKDQSKQQKLKIKKQSKLFESVTVAKDQSNAVHRHLDSASECEQNCVFLQRRIRMHKQQILIGLEGISTKTLSRRQFLDFVISHLKLLKLNDHKYRTFIAFLRKSFYGEMFDVIKELEEEISDKSSYEEELKINEKTRELKNTNPQLQISTDRLQKSQQKMNKREQRKKLRDEESKAEEKRGNKTHKM